MSKLNIKLSKFYHSIKIDKDVFAVFNSLLMEVLYVDSSELKYIENCESYDNKFTSTLFNAGIYTNGKEDDEAFNYLNNCLNDISGKIDIMYLIVTQNCNLDCTYCFLHNNPSRNFSFPAMDLSIAKKAINKFHCYIKENNISNPTIIFYGGEPLIKKDIVKKSIEYAITLRKDWKFSIITNGTLLDESTTKFCVDHSVTIGLSIDGPKFLHDKNRRYYGTSAPSYDQCMKAKELLDKQGCNYGLSMVLSKDVIRYKKEVFDWLFKNHKGDVFFNLLHFNIHDDEANEYIKQATRFMIDFYELCENNNFQISDGRIQRQIDSFIEQKFSFSDCGAVGCHQITVLPNGQLCICHGDSVNSNYFLGDINEINLSKLKMDYSAQKWSSLSTLSDKECLNCPAIFICGRGCPHHAGNLFGSRDLKDKNYCYYVSTVFNWLLKRGYINNSFEGGIKNEKT